LTVVITTAQPTCKCRQQETQPLNVNLHRHQSCQLTQSCGPPLGHVVMFVCRRC